MTEERMARQVKLIRLVGELVRRAPSVQINGGISRLNEVEDRAETMLIKRVLLGRVECSDYQLVSAALKAIFEIARTKFILGFFPNITKRVRNVVAASVVVDPATLPFVLNYREWDIQSFPYPVFHGIFIGALEGLFVKSNAKLVTPDEPGLVGDTLGSALVDFSSTARERSWYEEMEKVTDTDLEQSLGQLVAKVIEAFGDTFVSAFLRPFTSFKGGFPEGDSVGFVEQVLRHVMIKHLVRRPTPALLQLCTGRLATGQH